jgi:tripartite-type tricarboxylate transporter receptor subunit TctC
VPKGTPPAIVARIADALNKSLAMPDVRSKLESQGAIVAPSTPEQYATALQDQIGLAEHMMQVAHLQPQ